MDFLPEHIQNYAAQHSDVEPSYLYDLYRETHLKVLRPRMLSGHIQGRFLSMFSKMISPKLIVELGTYTGYSALCLAEGLRPDGRLITIDSEEEYRAIQSKYIELSPFKAQIHTVISDASAYISKLPDEIDLVFIDADKENYLVYYKALLPKLRTGGYIIADNVLWSGKVAEKGHEKDKETIFLRAFNDYIHSDESVENVLLAVRDGLMIIRKK